MCGLKGNKVLLNKKTSKNPWQKTSEIINTINLKINSNAVRNMGKRVVSLPRRILLRKSTRVENKEKYCFY